MNEVAKPLPRVGVVVGRSDRHVEGALAEEGLGSRRHVLQIVSDDEHLHDGPVRVEEGDLDRPPTRDPISLFPQVDVAQVRRRDHVVVAQSVEEHLQIQTTYPYSHPVPKAESSIIKKKEVSLTVTGSDVLRTEGTTGPNFGSEAFNRGNRFQASV